jgi:hypothetical protein
LTVIWSCWPVVTLPAQKRGHLGLDRGLQQQPRTEPGHLLNRTYQILAAGEHLIDLRAQPLGGDTLFDTDVGSFLRLARLRGNLRPTPFAPRLGHDRRAWTGKHEQWLCTQRFDTPGLQQAYDAAFDAMLTIAASGWIARSRRWPPIRY